MNGWKVTTMKTNMKPKSGCSMLLSLRCSQLRLRAFNLNLLVESDCVDGCWPPQPDLWPRISHRFNVVCVFLWHMRMYQLGSINIPRPLAPVPCKNLIPIDLVTYMQISTSPLPLSPPGLVSLSLHRSALVSSPSPSSIPPFRETAPPCLPLLLPPSLQRDGSSPSPSPPPSLPSERRLLPLSPSSLPSVSLFLPVSLSSSCPPPSLQRVCSSPSPSPPPVLLPPFRESAPPLLPVLLCSSPSPCSLRPREAGGANNRSFRDPWKRFYWA